MADQDHQAKIRELYRRDNELHEEGLDFVRTWLDRDRQELEGRVEKCERDLAAIKQRLAERSDAP